MINRKVILPITENPQVIYYGEDGDHRQLMHALIYECSHASVSQLCKYLACCPFGVHTSLLPCELNIEINLCVEGGTYSVSFPPLPYAYFLSFLCSYHLHDVRLQVTYLHLLQSMLNDEHFGFDKKRPWYIILNMVGICYEMMGDVSNAAHYYSLSANGGMMPSNVGMIPEFHESANIRLQLLMMRNNIYH